MEVSPPWNSFSLLQQQNQNITNQFYCHQKFEEDILNIHQLTQPFNLQFIHEVSKSKKYRTHFRINLSRKLTALMYKPHNIKKMPPNFKEKYRQKLMKNRYKPRCILKCVQYYFVSGY